MTRRRYSPVKVTRRDGTVDVQPAYDRHEARKVVGQGHRTETGTGGRAPQGLVAKLHSTCPACSSPICPGDRIHIRGWEDRRAFHAACAADWRPG